MAEFAQAQPVEKKAQIFFNEACADCGVWVQSVLPEVFARHGYVVEFKDYINRRENRKELSQLNSQWNVPFALQSHIEIFVGDNLLIGGHVPVPIIDYLLENPDQYERLLVYQDKMHGEETAYEVWDFAGEIKMYPIDEPITTYLAERDNEDLTVSERSFWDLLFLITGAAFLDGLNPCAFAVLLFFIGFLFALKKTRAKIWQMGIVYVAAIYLAYLLIGLGIAQAIIISGSPHLFAKIGAYLVIGLGIIQLLGLIFPYFPIRLRIPMFTKSTLEHWLHRATLPAAFVGGFLVGLCTFPCSGGIYVAIIGLISTQGSVGTGIAWMLWYDLFFILPLLILLALAANKKSAAKLQQWERSSAVRLKLIGALLMLVVGIVILVFFT
ncbi:MAG: hypothetical protein NUV82_03500 [Candidatus Komeilibacteria bacterium]|nr:hypothetical protein [Candidatus Komeilibacteria bacterium]